MNPPVLTPLATKRRIKRIAPLQLGKMLALLYGIMGLVLVPLLLLAGAISSQLPEGQRGGMMAFGVGFAIAAPFLYAAMGFVFGIIGAFIYNVVAKWVGGVEVEVE